MSNNPGRALAAFISGVLAAAAALPSYNFPRPGLAGRGQRALGDGGCRQVRLHGGGELEQHRRDEGAADRGNVLTLEEGTPQQKYAAVVNWSLDRLGATGSGIPAQPEPQSSASSTRSHSRFSTSSRARRLSSAGTIVQGAWRVCVSAIMSRAAAW
jgi:hypothetical protein